MSNIQKMIGILGFVVVLGMGIEDAWAACPTPPSGYDCECNGDDTRWVCAKWAQGGAPEADLDFIVTYTGNIPRVEFVNADDGWELYSEVLVAGVPTGPADLGDVLLASNVEPNIGNFKVTIKKGTGIGAANVTSIVLDTTDVDWTGGSSLKDARISENVGGAITLIAGSGGGDVTGAVFITGHVVGPISIPKITGSVAIFGNVFNLIDVEEISGSFQVEESDDITVGTLSGTLTVVGTVPFGKTVTIQNLTVTGDVTLGTLGGGLELINGLPSECSGGSCPPDPSWANVGVGVLSSTGVIDLNGADVAGTLSVIQGENNSQIIAGGDVSGFIYPGFTTGGYFNGTVTVSSVSAIGTLPTLPTGEIEAFLGAALNGIVNVSGSVAGVVEASGPFTGQINVGSVAAGGVIEAFQGALGTIVVDGALLGTVEVVGDLGGIIKTTSGGTLGPTGIIEVSGALTGSAKILVSGMCDGEVQIGQQTDASTLIHLLGGLESTGKVKVNATKGNFNADGDIHVGPIYYLTTQPPAQPPAITFDGCIRIHDEAGTGNGGDLSSGAEIKVVGCHEDGGIDDDLNICIDGSINGDITIVQTDCPHQVVHSCSTCP